MILFHNVKLDEKKWDFRAYEQVKNELTVLIVCLSPLKNIHS